jgi:isoamylase
VDLEGIKKEGQSLIAFTRKLIRLRNSLPILRRGRFLTAEYNPALEVKDVMWINASGKEMQKNDWEDGKMRCFGMLIDGRAQTSGIKRRASNVTLLIVVNGYHEPVKFTLPEFVDGDQWLTLIDTNNPERSETSTLRTGNEYEVTGRSLLLLAALTSGEPVKVIWRLASDLLHESARLT